MPNSITNADVSAWLKLTDPDETVLTPVVAATHAWVASSCPVLAGLDPSAAWPDDVHQGAVILAARWYRRRNTPAGVESYADNVVYLPRRDPDVSALLHLARPGLG